MPVEHTEYHIFILDSAYCNGSGEDLKIVHPTMRANPPLYNPIEA